METQVKRRTFLGGLLALLGLAGQRPTYEVFTFPITNTRPNRNGDIIPPAAVPEDLNGGYVVPPVFDDALIMVPVMHGEIFQVRPQTIEDVAAARGLGTIKAGGPTDDERWRRNMRESFLRMSREEESE